MDLRLVDYRQTVKLLEPNSHYEPREYSNASPLLVRAKRQFRQLSQAGYAVGWGVQVEAPAPLFPDVLLGARDVQYEQLDDVQWKTTWSYVMAISDAEELDLVAWQAWPETIEVVE